MTFIEPEVFMLKYLEKEIKGVNLQLIICGDLNPQ
jgi:hypothetical protein